MIEFRHLRTIEAVARTGNLTVAAQRLHLTQSALSHQLRELETGLGVTLVDRRQRPLRLTQAGERLLRLAQQVLPLVEEAVAGIEALRAGRGGRLALASECHSCLEWVLPRLAAFRARFPSVELDVRLMVSQDAAAELLTGRLDLLLTPDRRSLSGLAWQPLFDYELRLALPPTHPLANRTWVTPQALASETLLVYPVARDRLDVFTRFLWPAGIEPRRVRQADSSQLLLELVALEQGVAALPDWLCAPMEQAGGICTLGFAPRGLSGRLWAAVREAEAGLPHLAGFLALLLDATPGQVANAETES